MPRLAAPSRPVPLSSADPIVPDLDAPEPLTRLDVLNLLPQNARMDLLSGTLAGNFGGRP